MKKNPHGRVPVLEDHDVIVWESHAILRYLAARYGGEQFWSADPSVRSLTDRWMDWSQSSLQPDFLTGIFWGFYRTPDNQRDWPAINAAIARTNRHFGQLENQLKDRAFVLGEKLTLADIPAATTLYRYFEMEIERPSLPCVERWYRILQERPAYRQHVMLPFHELRGRLAF